METLSVDIGVATYNLKSAAGECEIQFNPTDMAFVDQINSAFEELKRRQESINSPDTEDAAAVFEYARKQDMEMREIIDGLFEKPVCESIYGKMNVWASANGLPVWLNLFTSIFDKIDKASEDESRKYSAQVKKYTDKYRKKRRK